MHAYGLTDQNACEVASAQSMRGRSVSSLAGTFENDASLLGMSRAPHTTEVQVARQGTPLQQQARVSIWTYLPILFSAAVICLLLFFFLSPNFEAAEPMRARSARPGAETGVTQQERAFIEHQKDKNPHSP